MIVNSRSNVVLAPRLVGKPVKLEINEAKSRSEFYLNLEVNLSQIGAGCLCNIYTTIFKNQLGV